MSDIELTVKIPEGLAHEAQQLGLLQRERLIALLEAAIEREARRDRAIQSARETIAKLDALEPKLTQEEIDEAVREVRSQS